jgi:lipoyl(octanoyl) transferase
MLENAIAIPPGRQLHGVEWAISAGLTPYSPAIAAMEARAHAIRAGTAGEAVWLVEHPPTYTAGTSAKPEDLKETRFPTVAAGRGGQVCRSA